MVDLRRKNVNWQILPVVEGSRSVSPHDAHLAVLMDIRDELQAINSKLSCFRLPRALDSLIEIGQAERRRKRLAAKRRREARK